MTSAHQSITRIVRITRTVHALIILRRAMDRRVPSTVIPVSGWNHLPRGARLPVCAPSSRNTIPTRVFNFPESILRT
jgi:hypothetical protein